MRRVLIAVCCLAGMLVGAGSALAQQELALRTEPNIGVAVPFADHSGFMYTGPAGSVSWFTVLARDAYGDSVIEVTVDGPAGTALVENEEDGGPVATAAVLDRAVSAAGEATVTLLVYVWQPNIADALGPIGPSPLSPGVMSFASGDPDPGDYEPDYPRPDDSGRCHDDLPDRVPTNWGPETIQDAIDAIEESIGQREWENDLLGPDAGHDDRIRQEEEWLRKL